MYSITLQDNEKGITAMELDFSGSGIASLQVDPGMHDILHSTVAKLMFISNCARQDILIGVSFLDGRVLYPAEEDRGKLNRVLQYKTVGAKPAYSIK